MQTEPIFYVGRVVSFSEDVQMRAKSKQKKINQRRNPRLAAEGQVRATVVDDHDQPIIVLRDVEVVNVSAGGMAFITHTAVTPSAVVNAFVGDDTDRQFYPQRIRLEVLDCAPHDHRRYRVRCRLLEGSMPARLIADWFAGQHHRPVPA